MLETILFYSPNTTNRLLITQKSLFIDGGMGTQG